MVIAALVLAGACARQETGPALRPVSLPDLSKMSGSVQAQIRDAHASVITATENRAAAPTALADAYGTLGRALHGRRPR